MLVVGEDLGIACGVVGREGVMAAARMAEFSAAVVASSER
jgi:hypothetical protein